MSEQNLNNREATVLITGGTGFVGSHLLTYLQALGYRQIHLTSYGQVDDWFLAQLPATQIHQIDLTDQLATKKLLKQLSPRYIYHLASIASVGDSFIRLQQILDNNIKLQLSLLVSLQELNLHSKILIVGSADEYGASLKGELPINEQHPFRPVNPYAVSKITQDMLAYTWFKAYKQQIIRVRPFAHIGARQTANFSIASFAKQIALIEKGKQEILQVGNLSARRDFTDVRDVVKAYHLLMQRGEVGEVYNIGSGRAVTMKQVVDWLIDLAKVPIKIKTDVARLRPIDIDVMVADVTKLEKLGWQPSVSLQESLKTVLNYWRETL